jgi:deoxyuridine 5'-triphosphate nucleotidohydrolase
MSMNWHDRWFPNYKLNFERSLGLSVKFRKLVSEAVTPQYAQNGDAGLDLTVEIPIGHVGLLFPRSSITKAPCGVSLKNSVGVIDSNYRGEILVRFEKPTHETYVENHIPVVGDKVAQLIILPYPTVYFEEVQELSDSNRGNGGFGSTGK